MSYGAYNPLTGRASADQVDLLARLVQSHVFTDEERAETKAEISEGLDKERASKLIDRALSEIKRRKAAERRDAPDPDIRHGGKHSGDPWCDPAAR